MKIGFLGCGNMGGALARAVRRAMPGAEILLSDPNEERRLALCQAIDAHGVDAPALFREADAIFLGLKPQVLPAVLPTLAPDIGESRAFFISMAAGVELARLAFWLPDKAIIRIMPNTAVELGAGVTLFAPNALVTEEQKAAFVGMMTASGLCDEIPEEMIDAASAVSGCGPAFAQLFLEGLVAGGRAAGLDGDRALLYAARTVEGAMRMAVATGRAPRELCEAVCSPGGSTVEGVKVLLDGGLLSLAEDAVMASYRRTKELGKS